MHAPTTTDCLSDAVKIFPQKVFCSAQVVGANHTSDASPLRALDERIWQMLHGQKMGTVRQVEIDSLVMPYILAMNRDPVLDLVHWQDLVSRTEDTFQTRHLPDIGQQVRCMILRHNDDNNQMLHLLRYSMPYIKHNRLSFFAFKQARVETLQNVLRLQLATCLGLHSENSKKPTWKIRVQLVAMFTKLLACGTPMDMHLFCCAHIPLLRISLIEYYVYFVEKNMPIEASLQHRLFGFDSNPSVIFRQIKCVADVFRQTQFQNTHLDWDSVTTRAQSAVERCNRCCKGVVAKYAHQESAVGKSHALTGMLQAHSLPFNTALMQVQQLQRKILRDTVLSANSCYFFACMHCAKNVPDKRLRTAENNAIVCSTCQSEDSIVKINIIGRVVSVSQRKFYLCPFCMVVHEWLSCGYELTRCPHTPKLLPPARACVICGFSPSSLHTVPVLDSHLGVMQHVCLCNRHMPYEHQMKYVHDLGVLVKRIQNKYVKK